MATRQLSIFVAIATIISVIVTIPPTIDAFAFTTLSRHNNKAATTTTTTTTPPTMTLHAATNNTNNNNRRRFFAAAASVTLSTIGGAQQATAASSKPPTAEELDRIKVGYERMQYLLNNFERETTVCRENGGECKRDADPVRRYMGLRSTTDPLFQIEKVFEKVKNMDIDPDKLEDFFQATEDWNTAVNMSNSMAFISQFGEYNPGGGKDEVLKYLNESQKQVVIAEKALKKIMECLEI